jgi:hypothetical protein
MKVFKLLFLTALFATTFGLNALMARAEENGTGYCPEGEIPTMTMDNGMPGGCTPIEPQPQKQITYPKNPDCTDHLNACWDDAQKSDGFSEVSKEAGCVAEYIQCGSERVGEIIDNLSPLLKR